MKKAKEKVGSSTSNLVRQLNGGGFKESVLGSVPAIKKFVFGNSSETETNGVMNGGSYASVAAGLKEQVHFCPPEVLDSGEKGIKGKYGAGNSDLKSNDVNNSPVPKSNGAHDLPNAKQKGAAYVSDARQGIGSMDVSSEVGGSSSKGGIGGGINGNEVKMEYRVKNKGNALNTKPGNSKLVNTEPLSADPVRVKLSNSTMYSVTSKLKSLKKPLRKLALEQGNLAERVKFLRKELGRIQEALVADNSSQDLRDEELIYLHALKDAEEDEELFLKQKAKIDWLAAGDQNTSYFHKAVKGWQSRSRINGIKDMNGNYHEGEQAGEAFVDHFKSFMGNEVPMQSLVDPNSLFTKHVPREVADYMVRPVTKEEVKEAIFDIDDDKAPGLDGFSAKIFKASWSIVGDEVCRAIQEFFENGKLLTEINATIISLIPKCHSPSNVADYRPIACCNVLYKGITKVICNRIKHSFDLVVSNNQSAFIPGRQIVDNVFIAQELMRNYHRKGGARRLAVKIDLQKAYDTVNHDFLEKCLIHFVYHPCMVGWIMKCLRSACYSINVNGDSYGFFKGKRGLRQGDPMSPYLFTLVMEVLTLIINRRIREAGNFNYHWKCRKLGITNLCFANDLLIFVNADCDSVKVIKVALEEFSGVSGLLPNMNKSTMYFGNVLPCTKAEIMDLLPFKVGVLPVRYLGLPLLAKRLYSKDCASLIDRVKKRVDDWKNKSLSFAGRLQLIKSVLASMQVYWASVFLLPISIIEDIERIINKFLWTQTDNCKGKVRVSWNEVCFPKSQGGLGIKSLKVRNKALVSKLVWNIISGKENIWTKWIQTHRLEGRSLWEIPDKRDKCWSWRNIMKCRDVVWPHCYTQIGNGETTSVWFDMWHPLSPLCSFISNRVINRAGLSTYTKVKDVVVDGRWAWPEEWRDMFPGLFNSEPPKLIIGKADKVVWRSNDGSLGLFSTKAAFSDLCDRQQDVHWAPLVWFSQSIPRHSFTLWMACKRRLLTQDRLQKWDVEGELKCVFCRNQRDSHTHLFFECDYYRQVWNRLKRRAMLDNAPDSLEECTSYISASPKSKSIRSIIQRLMFGAIVYFIWQERNWRISRKGKEIKGVWLHFLLFMDSVLALWVKKLGGGWNMLVHNAAEFSSTENVWDDVFILMVVAFQLYGSEVGNYVVAAVSALWAVNVSTIWSKAFTNSLAAVFVLGYSAVHRYMENPGSGHEENIIDQWLRMSFVTLFGINTNRNRGYYYEWLGFLAASTGYIRTWNIRNIGWFDGGYAIRYKVTQGCTRNGWMPTHIHNEVIYCCCW
ncbi:hypothetical protein SSX86_008299 [Deinandra increscens subsp. villosa]|uniref:Reverse transcriptase domain-containing protein n=1 Tax=Deinandra increscens subsp. villosa TaxID=3103831 RepID=A0AAP0DBF6_9ASTR